MAIKRYTANSDTTITNAFESNLTNRGTDANMGASDILEIFSLYGQNGGTSSELERTLIKFPVDEIISDRAAEDIPAVGKVNFYLKMHNAPHSQTLPRNFTLSAKKVTTDWQEGIGLDMEEYKDKTYGNAGATWVSASNTTTWTRMGGDYDATEYKQTFAEGTEDLELDITTLIEDWVLNGNNYGIGLQLTASEEAYHSGAAGADDVDGELNNLSGATLSYYTKKFFARSSEFFFKRPVIEARWNSSIQDDRGDFYASSSMVPAADNLNTIYLYNISRGQYVDIPNYDTDLNLRIYATLGGSTIGSSSIGRVSAGIYSASFALDTTASTVYDVWYSGSAEERVNFHTGTIDVKTHAGSTSQPNTEYYSNITNLKPIYSTDESPRLQLYVRPKDWSPTIYTVASQDIETTPIEKAAYKVYRVVDDLEVIPYGTGSDNHTIMSYDEKGNHFNLDMSLLQSDYAYGIKVAFYNPSTKSYVEQRQAWKFRVEDLDSQ